MTLPKMNDHTMKTVKDIELWPLRERLWTYEEIVAQLGSKLLAHPFP